MSAKVDDLFKKVIAHSKEYGFIFPSSEIYDGLAAVYDYGSYGVELKNNIKQYWWKSMVQMHENIVGLDTAIFMNPQTWKASGHVDAFSDPLIDNKDSNKRYRADVLIEDFVEKINLKIVKDITKAKKRFGDAFDEKEFRATNGNVLRRQQQMDEINNRFQKALEADNLEEVRQIIIDLEISCPVSGTKNWTEVKQFNLMFSTQIGASADNSSTVYLRPETAQGTFVNFLNVLNTSRQRIPFGIAQIGKAFRNEIVARQFIFRVREFEQMEMQFFVRPGTEDTWYAYWKEARQNWHLALGMNKENYRFHDHLKMAHYAKNGSDIEFDFPFGFKELEGIHSRTDFDLKQHQELSGKKLQYFDPEINESYVPYVVETAIGVDRMFLSVMSASYKEEVVSAEKNTSRVVLKLPPVLAPIKVAVFPLTKKDGMPEKAKEIFNALKFDMNCYYEEKDNIGKRYRRQDAVGTPYCITVDHQTLEDNTVTIRERDSMEQERVSIQDVAKIVADRCSWKTVLA